MSTVIIDERNISIPKTKKGVGLTDLTEGGFLNGVRANSTNTLSELSEFPPSIGIPQSILKAPIFVSSERAAKIQTELSITWTHGSFTFSRNGGHPFPTFKHAFYFLILLSKFACRWNSEGKVYFTFSEILRLSGNSPKSSNGIKSIVDCIWRYMHAHAIWEDSFGPKHKAWAGSLIRKCDLWDDDGVLNKKNPGNSKDQTKWHSITFNEEIVNALERGETRLYYSNIYKMKLSQPEIIIYNYFYSFGDHKSFWHSLYHENSGLIKAFSWTIRKDKFFGWLSKHLESLKSKGLLEEYKFRDDKKAVYVKSMPIEKLDSIGKPSINITPRSSKPTKQIQEFSNEQIWSEYLKRKKLDLIKADHIMAIDAVFNNPAMKSIAIEMIKNYVLKDEITI